MRKIAVYLSILLLPAIVFSEMIKKIENDSDGKPKAAVYYVDGKEVAREIFNQVVGKIPDGVVSAPRKAYMFKLVKIQHRQRIATSLESSLTFNEVTS